MVDFTAFIVEKTAADLIASKADAQGGKGLLNSQYPFAHHMRLNVIIRKRLGQGPVE